MNICFCKFSGKQQKIAKYYKKQESLLQGFTEMENIQELGYVDGTPTDVPCYFLFEIWVF